VQPSEILITGDSREGHGIVFNRFEQWPVDGNEMFIVAAQSYYTIVKLQNS
jgi:hypothetical protein